MFLGGLAVCITCKTWKHLSFEQAVSDMEESENYLNMVNNVFATMCFSFQEYFMEMLSRESELERARPFSPHCTVNYVRFPRNDSLTGGPTGNYRKTIFFSTAYSFITRACMPQKFWGNRSFLANPHPPLLEFNKLLAWGLGDERLVVRTPCRKWYTCFS